jgi:hypothetical protein
MIPLLKGKDLGNIMAKGSDRSLSQIFKVGSENRWWIERLEEEGIMRTDSYFAI